MCSASLRYAATADTLTLFWEKPGDAAPREQYTVVLDGKAVGETDRTHFTLRGLAPGTAYVALIRRENGESTVLPVKTASARRALDVARRRRATARGAIAARGVLAPARAGVSARYSARTRCRGTPAKSLRRRGASRRSAPARRGLLAARARLARIAAAPALARSRAPGVPRPARRVAPTRPAARAT